MHLLLFGLSILIVGCVSSCASAQDDDSSLKTGFIDVGETRLYYEEMGEGRPVVMVHAALLDRRMWDDQFELYGEDYRVIRYDARGHGLSDSATDPFSHHQDLALLMDGLNIERATIMGMSMGGYIAVDFALEYPERATALVLVAPGLTGFTFTSEEDTEFRKNISKAAQEGDFDRVVEYFQRAWTDGPRRSPDQVDPTVRERVESMASAAIRKRNPKRVLVRLDPPAIGRLHEIRVPVLAIVGDLDMPGIMEIVDLIERDVEGAQKVVITDVAHMVNMEKPQEFNRAVLDFLATVKDEIDPPEGGI
jgi:pimeloyl-ACP methyl ester carboxylesterase